MMNTILLCPVCREALGSDGSGLACPRGHRFDRAAKGYTNLLLGSRADHGDSREMIAARRRFLESGAYRSVALALSDALAEYAPSDAAVLDAGCGEGYYTERLAERHPLCRFFGIDVSKEAIRAAAGRQTLKGGNCCLYVAGVYALPFVDASFDAVLSVFSPFAREEFLRTLKKDGILLSVIPGAKHLWDLKRVLYDTPYENEVADYAVEGFEFLGKKEIHERFLLKTPEQIRDLFTMTPYYHRTPRQGRERLSALESLETELSFEVLCYRRL